MEKNLFICIAICIAIFICNNIYAQYQFQYQLDFKIDSTNRESVQTEYFNLDVMEDKSIFYAQSYAKLDSIQAEGGNINQANMPAPKLDYMVKKDLSENEVIFNDVIGFARYEVEEPAKMEWKILPDTKNVDLNTKDSYQLQKATTNFVGRKWIAWFASEISVQDGPYKFHKLPGLIVELYDSQEDYSFSLINIEKKDRLFSSSLFKNLGIQTYKVDYKKYKKIENKFHKNPGAAFRQYMTSMGIDVPNSEVKNFSKKTKERLKKQNNTIELNK